MYVILFSVCWGPGVRPSEPVEVEPGCGHPPGRGGERGPAPLPHLPRPLLYVADLAHYVHIFFSNMSGPKSQLNQRLSEE